MVNFPVVCPVCGRREELEASTPDEVLGLLEHELPRCPDCGWQREEDHRSPVWDRFGEVYKEHMNGHSVSQAHVDHLSRGLG
jgi:hypothetical protein